MGALRKAGVWLGLVEEEDDRTYDARYDDDFDEDDDDFEPPARPRALSRTSTGRSAAAERSVERLAERSQAGDRAALAERAGLAERSGHLDRGHLDRGHGDRHPDRGQPERGQAERAGVTERPALTERTGEHSRVLSDRSSVRPLTRAGTQSSGYSSSSTTSYPTQDGLALVPPQVQLRDRSAVPEDPERRYQITTLHPTTYTEARTIGEHFRDGVPVIINLTEMDEADARRLVDFAAGLAFGLRGNIERVTNRVFLLSPANVQVTAEDKAKIAEGGFFDQS